MFHDACKDGWFQRKPVERLLLRDGDEITTKEHTADTINLEQAAREW